MPRIFIAVPVSDGVRFALSELAMEAPRDAPALRWVAPHQYHITLKFLGDITEHDVERVREATERAVVGRSEPFRLRARGLGAFPDVRRARTIWVGVAGDSRRLHDIRKNIDTQLAARGSPREQRPFQPHITIARSRNAEPLSPLLQRYAEHDFGSWSVDRIDMIESQLSATGPRYVVRHEIMLDGGN